MAAKVRFAVVLLFLGCLVVVAVAASSQIRSEEETAGLFESWLQSYPRSYSSDLGEKNLRYEIFKHNLKRIDAHNEKEDSSFKLGLNQFADLTFLEFKKTFLGKARTQTSRNESSTPFRYANVIPPAAVDWRKKEAVTPIKDQGQCGSCWTFSTIGAVEGIVQITTGKLISLSEQELVSCDTANGNAGCNGGDMYPAMEWIVRNGGVNSEKSYPYTGQDDACNISEMKVHVASINGQEHVPANSEKALQQAVANQPVAVSIDGGDYHFQFYTSGILSGTCGTELDHGVVAVGYGTTSAGEDFWIVKNSWGTTWGEEGYIRLQRNIKAPEGMCGIAMDNSYPTKD